MAPLVHVSECVTYYRTEASCGCISLNNFSYPENCASFPGKKTARTRKNARAGYKDASPEWHGEPRGCIVWGLTLVLLHN
jgi:hypothetical protein